MFRDLGRVADALLLEEALPGLGPAARLEENGDLLLDRAAIDRVRSGFAERLGPGYLQDVERTREDRCDALVAATRAGAAASRDASEREARDLVVEIGRRIAAVLPYAISGKFVPDILLQALGKEAAGRDPLPFTPAGGSPGSRLSAELFTLYLECLDRGYPPHRLQAEWPDVDAPLASAVRSFLSEHTGFGPVAWEAAGFETAAYVFAAMAASFPGVDPEALRGRNSRRQQEASPKGEPQGWGAQLERAVGAWAGFIEQEIWFVRGAFYLGMLPLLRVLAASRTAASADAHRDDLLFVELGELAATGDGLPDPASIARRREAYLENTAYRSRHGIEDDRLGAIMGGLW